MSINVEALTATEGTNQPGFVGSARYEVLDDPDTLVEPLVQLLAAPFRATVMRELR